MKILASNPRKNLKRVLCNQVVQFQETGGSPATAISALTEYKKILVQRLVIQFLAFLVLLVTGIYISISLFSDQSALAAVVSAIVGIAASLITNLFGTWRELAYSNLILMLIRDSNDDQIKSIIDKLIDKL
jgi:hypothetical protein